MYAERTSGRTADPMKERAIVIYLNWDEREERKKRAEVWKGLTGATGSGGVYAFPFSISDNMGHAYDHHLQKKGYQSLVSSFSVYNRRGIKCDDTTLSCQVI